MGSSQTKERLELASKTKQLNLEDDDKDNYEKWGKILSKKVPDLRSLSFSGNKFSGVVPPTFLASLKNLKVLRMDRNQLTNADAVCLVPCLEVLSLCQNRLTGFAIGLPPQSTSPLIELHLSQNNLTSISSEIFKVTPKLKVLVLDNNKLMTLPDTLCSCSQLESISAADNVLTRLPEGPWEKCGELRHVDMSRNRLTAIPPTLLSSTKLYKLELTGNVPFTVDDLKGMGPDYEAFERRQRHVVNKGLQGGLVVKLN